LLFTLPTSHDIGEKNTDRQTRSICDAIGQYLFSLRITITPSDIGNFIPWSLGNSMLVNSILPCSIG
jgi:hypothetical protein